MKRYKNSGKTGFVLAVGFTLLLLASGCSHKASSQSQGDGIAPPPDAGTDAVPQAAVEDRSGDPSMNPPAPPTADASAVPPAPASASDAPAPIVDNQTAPAPIADNQTAPAPIADNQTAPAAPAAQSTTPPADSSGSGTYTVQAGDTLMKIAFETYGDLYKWKDIYESNKDKISNPNAVPPGTQLKLDKPATAAVVERNGSQYLIKNGDTLGTISNDVYGTRKKWKRLWKNNKQLIPDPNKIYAGFYLYYTLTPQERQDYKRRKGVDPEDPQTAPAPLAEKSGDSAPDTTAPADQPSDQQPAAASAQAQPAQPQPEVQAAQPAALAQPAQPQPEAQVAQPQSPTEAPRAPSSVTAAPADHSADLNEVVQQAQKEERAVAAPAAAGP